MKIYYKEDDIYPATHNFKDEADGTTNNDIDGLYGFSTNDTNGAVVIVASDDGHRKIVKISGDGDNGKATNIYVDPVSETSGTIEFWFKYIDNGVGTFRFYFYDQSATAMLYSLINSATNQITSYYGDGIGGADTVVSAVSADTWIHYKWTFDCATDTMSLWLDGDIEIDDENFINDLNSTTFLRHRFYLYGGGGANALEGYFDAIGYSWDTNYNVGDNRTDE